MIVGILTELFLSGAYGTSNDKILECDYLSLYTEQKKITLGTFLKTLNSYL